MIEFNCICRQHRFSLPADQAGTLVQCPVCRRLADVPTLDELAHLDEEGGYRVNTPASEAQPLDARAATRAFGRHRIDEFGNEIDLRPTFEDIARAGTTEFAGTIDGKRPIPPKYDPDTGELIRPLPIRGEAPKRVLPVEHVDHHEEPIDAIPIPVPTLSYQAARRSTQTLAHAFIALFAPANLFVMLFVFLMHMLLQAIWFIALNGFIIVGIFPFALFIGLVGHYGNVVDDVGPGERDELPAPLRNVSIYDDLWKPFCNISAALMLAFSPLIICWISGISGPTGALIRFACVLIGAVLTPALLLSANTSGTYLNLRPDRVIGVISVIGAPRYLWLIFSFAIAAFIYIFSLDQIDESGARLVHLGPHNTNLTLAALAVSTGLLAVGIYLMHVFFWQLGLLYREGHEHFPWVLQRHVPVRLAQRTRPASGHLPPVRHA
jgi:hypothetical protein